MDNWIIDKLWICIFYFHRTALEGDLIVRNRAYSQQ